MTQTNEIYQKLRLALTAVGGWAGWFLGGADGLLTALLVLMALDYISGVMRALHDKSLSSAIGFKGICKKVMVILLVGLSNVVDRHVIGAGSLLRGAVICFYISNEALSVIENATALGLPVPQKLRQALKQLRDKGDESDGSD